MSRDRPRWPQDRRQWLFVAIAAALAIASIGTMGAASAQNTCDIEMTTPVIEGSGDDRHIFASATRSGCTTSARMTLRLRQDRRFWFDRNLKTIERTGTNFTATLNYDCRGSGHMRVFAEAIVSGDKHRSRDIAATFCR
jgi:hypothetical protein